MGTEQFIADRDELVEAVCKRAGKTKVYRQPFNPNPTRQTMKAAQTTQINV